MLLLRTFINVKELVNQFKLMQELIGIYMNVLALVLEESPLKAQYKLNNKKLNKCKLKQLLLIRNLNPQIKLIKKYNLLLL